MSESGAPPLSQLVPPPSPPAPPTPAKERVGAYLYFASLYFVTAGVLYLWGYWASFDVNILEYLSLSDILKATAYPIISALGFTLLSFAIGPLIEGLGDRPRSDPLSEDVLPIGPRMKWLLTFYWLAVCTLLGYGTDNWKWGLLPLVIGTPVALELCRRGILGALVRNEQMRSTILLVFCILPPYAFCLGRLDALKILDGTAYKFVASAVKSADGVTDLAKDAKLRYVGHAGESIFLMHPKSQNLLITKFDHLKVLDLQHFKLGESASPQPSPSKDQAKRQPTPPPPSRLSP